MWLWRNLTNKISPWYTCLSVWQHWDSPVALCIAGLCVGHGRGPPWNTTTRDDPTASTVSPELGFIATSGLKDECNRTDCEWWLDAKGLQRIKMTFYDIKKSKENLCHQILSSQGLENSYGDCTCKRQPRWMPPTSPRRFGKKCWW